MTSRLVISPGAPGSPALFTIDPRGKRKPTDADELGLSDELADAIETWIDDLDGLYDDEAGRHVIDDLAERARQARIAEGIIRLIREELGEDWMVDADLAPVLGD